MNTGTSVKNRKDLIKNIAIIFLAIMLVLTFFSNTIMNYSLPEVATEYVQSDSIVAKIRGTGAVEADDPYKITVEETRTISSVQVKVGDTVVKDQVLFLLEDKDSEELKVAQEELDAMVLAYAQQILSGEISNTAYQNAQSGNIADIATFQTQIAAAKVAVENAKNGVTAAENNVAALQKQLDILNNKTVDTTDEENAVEQATLNLTKAQAELAQAEANLSAASAGTEGLPTASEAESAVVSAKLDEATKKAAYEAAIKEFNNNGGTVNNETDNKKISVEDANRLNTITDYKLVDHTTGRLSFEISMETDKMNIPVKIAIGELIDAHMEAIYLVDSTGVAFTTVKDMYNAYLASIITREEKEDTLNKVANSDLTALEQAVTDAQNKVKNCENALNTAKQNLANASNLSDENATKESISNQILEANAQVAAANKALEDATEAQADLITDIQAQLNLGDQNDKMADKRAEIAELKEKAMGATVVAPVDGVITALNKTAGESTMPEEELATMQVAGKGFTLSFSATAQQAAKVSVGDVAELQNSWYYDEILARLVSIKADPSDPKSKLLVFEITGENVQNGETLSLSVGQKSANYDFVVPNSAIREDNNGKFILIVESKSSPLGNRYIATRVDVEVLGSDDTKSAISGALYGYEYVITTATQPVEAGKQVRLTEN